jgi:N-acetylglucosamine-6-phosphate deacetylase
LGLAGKGHLDTGADADLVLWDEDLTAAMTWTKGALVYEKK